MVRTFFMLIVQQKISNIQHQVMKMGTKEINLAGMYQERWLNMDNNRLCYTSEK